MKQPKVKALLRTDKPLTDNTFPIWIRITHLRRSSYIATGYSCQEEEWNPEASRLFEMKPRISQDDKEELNPLELKNLKRTYSTIKINPLAKKINSDIDKKVRVILVTKDKLEANEESLSPRNIKRQVAAKDSGYSGKSFIQYWEKQNKHLEGNQAFGTLKTYKSILRQLKGDGEIEGFMKGKDLLFEDITTDFLEEYQGFLKRTGYSKNTIHNHLKTFRSILYKAIKEPGKSYFSQDKNPFFAFKLEADKTQRKQRLVSEEIKAMQDLNLEKGTRLYDARNMFLFSFYCAGIRIGDLIQLTWSDIQEDRLVYEMGKTGKKRSIKLIPNAKGILKLYRSKTVQTEDFIFPLLSNNINRLNKQYFKRQLESKAALINKCLKLVAEKAEIKKNLSSHIARHSFADIARKKKTSLLDIQKLLGHSDAKTTQIYLESFDMESQDEAHEAVFQDFFSGNLVKSSS
jgi:integrase/recombinase XerD